MTRFPNARFSSYGVITSVDRLREPSRCAAGELERARGPVACPTGCWTRATWPPGFGVPVSWVRESTRSGAMRCVELGRYRRYVRADVES